jgi:hypothetical protein
LNDISSIPSNGNHQRLLISASFRRKGAHDSAHAVTVGLIWPGSPDPAVRQITDRRFFDSLMGYDVRREAI